MKKIFDVLEKILAFIVIVLGFVLVADVVLQILGRYVLSRPVSWTEELSRYLLAGIVTFATPIVARRGQYIQVDVLLNRLPDRTRKIWMIFVNLIVTVFLLVVSYHAVSYVQVGAMQKSPVLHIPMNYIFSSVVIGPALTALFFLEKAVECVVDVLKKGGRTC